MAAPVASTLAEKVLAGEVRAAARLMRDLDDRLPEAEAALRALFPRTGRAYVVGLTGAPGAGKSSLTDRLIARLRAAGKKVGVVAIDPTSPFTGGLSWAIGSGCRTTPSIPRCSSAPSGRAATAAASPGPRAPWSR